MKSFQGLALAGCLLAAACDRPECITANPVLARSAPESEPYKRELVRCLQAAPAVDYWIDAFEREGDARYLWVYAQGSTLCARMRLRLQPGSRWWPQANSAQARSGLGYHGAGLVGLRYAIRQTADSTDFVYQSERWVLD